MKTQILFLLLFISTYLSAQYDMVILPVQVSVYDDQRINVFHMKRDITKAVMAGQDEVLQMRYDSMAYDQVIDFMSTVANPVRYIEDEEGVPDSLQFEFFRLVRLLTDGEMKRLEEKKFHRGMIRVGKGSQEKWKAANEENSFPLIQRFSKVLNCRFLAVLKIVGQHKPRDRKTEDLVGGITYETIIIDCKTGQYVHFEHQAQGRRRETYEQQKKIETINPVRRISPESFSDRVDSLLKQLLKKHAKLAKAAARKEN